MASTCHKRTLYLQIVDLSVSKINIIYEVGDDD